MTTTALTKEESVSHDLSSPGSRIVGCDVARALAILGMMIVHFSEVLAGVKWPTGFLNDIMKLLDGRAAAVFIVLAGVGITLRSHRATEADDLQAITHVRTILLKRGLFLLAAGFLNLAIWPGDILRVYGISFLLAAWCFRLRDRTLLAISFSFAAGFIVLMGLLDYGKHWNFDTMDYRALRSPSGIIRNLFYDGYRSVFPWTGFVFFGVWLGRRNLRDHSVRNRLILIAAVVALSVEISSCILVRVLSTGPGSSNKEEITVVFGTVSMPPLPLFLLASGGAAVAVIVLCIDFAERWPTNRLIKSLASTGQLAFTWYMVHIMIGLGTIDTLGLSASRSLATGIACGIGFFAVTVLLSVLWKKKWQTSPLEWVIRWMASG